MFCENCGHQISDTAKFCFACGHPVGTAPSPGAVAPPAVPAKRESLISSWIGIFVGCTILAAGFVYFINPYNLVPGGVYGASIEMCIRDRATTATMKSRHVPSRN